MQYKNIEQSQIDFYLPKFQKYKDSFKSLSWNSKRSQQLRFKTLSGLFYLEKDTSFTIHEVGCGLGHFGEYLTKTFRDATYSGSDIIPEMITYCKKKYPHNSFSHVSIVDTYDSLNKSIGGSDYYCLSGTFNTKEGVSKKQWEKFIHTTIRNMFTLATKGIGFNFLTSHSDWYDSKLYYADPGEIINWCINNMSRFVSLHHNISLYEFTVYVYKEGFIRQQYRQQEFSKFFKK